MLQWKSLLPRLRNIFANTIKIIETRICKLRNPIKFSMFEIQRFACYTGSDPGKITRLVNEEIKSNTNLQKKLRKFKSVADLKQYNQKKTGRLNRQ